MSRLCSSVLLFAVASGFKVPLDEKGMANVYSLSITVGTPPQPFNLLVSLNEDFVWIPSKDCRNCNFLVPLPYDHSKSVTYEEDGRKMENHLTMFLEIDDWTHGYMSRDSLDFGGKGENKVHDMIIGETVEGRFFDFTAGYDGVFGLGRSANYSSGIVQQLFRKGKLERPVFGLSLDGGLYQNGTGQLDLGKPDESKYEKSTIKTLPCKEQPLRADDMQKSMWRVPLDGGIEVNGKGLETASKATGVVLNTASSYIYMPQKEMEALAAQIPGSMFYQTLLLVPRNASLTIKLKFSSDFEYILTEKDLITDSVFGSTYGAVLIAPRTHDDSTPDASGWVLGTAFLNKHYQIYDYGDKDKPCSVSFADKRPKPQRAGDPIQDKNVLHLPTIAKLGEEVYRNKEKAIHI